jgi:uncharacterized protein DUF4389
MSNYPVHVEVSSPPHFERIQLLLRIVLAIMLGWIGITVGWIVCLLYGLLPVIAAIAVSSRGGTGYTTTVGPTLWRGLRWLLQFGAYMALLTDRFPTGDDDPVRIELQLTGKPTLGSVLSRLATSIPSGVVLLLLWCVSSVLWLAAAGIVLVNASIPDPILAFQRGVLRWQARLLAYHASLVEEYPPFSFETGDGRDAAAAGSVAR